jgi:hypothetical protein
MSPTLIHLVFAAASQTERTNARREDPATHGPQARTARRMVPAGDARR